MKKVFALLIVVLLSVFAVVACNEKDDPPQPPPAAFCCYEQPLDQVPEVSELQNGDQIWRVTMMKKTYYWVRPAGHNSALPPGASLYDTVKR